MIEDLKNKAEERLGVKVTSTLVATPALPYLYPTNLHRSILDAGLEDLDDNNYAKIGCQFKQTNAVMAAWGIGMCYTYWDRPTCEHEIGRWPLERSITILYTSNALCVGMGDSQGIYGYEPLYSYPSSMDFTLGYGNRHHSPDEALYWTAVRERIMKGVLGSGLFLPRNHTVFVHGDKDAVENPKFREVLEGVIRSLLSDGLPIYYPDDPEFLAARGAAVVIQREGKFY